MSFHHIVSRDHPVDRAGFGTKSTTEHLFRDDKRKKIDEGEFIHNIQRRANGFFETFKGRRGGGKLLKNEFMGGARGL